MKILLVIIFAGTVLIFTCVYQKDLTEAEKEKYQRAREVYDEEQRDGP